jgi:transcriptional regulator PpsR
METVKTFDARAGGPGAADDGRTLSEVVRAAADVALLVDEGGVIRDLHLGSEPPLEEAREWLGRPWLETVTPESRRKVEEMLREARERPSSRRRQVTHGFASGADLPVAYTAVRMGSGGSVLALGRDLRGAAALQQRLVEAQQAMERDYWRLRHMETRYRLLFQLSSEPVLLVDAANRRVTDVNPAGARALGAEARQLVGKPFAVGADDAEREAAARHLDVIKDQGRAEPVAVHGADGEAFSLSAALVRQDAAGLFLVRLVPEGARDGGAADGASSRTVKALQASPDGFAVTDAAGRVMAVNRAFLEMTEAASEEQVRGERLDRWLGRPGADLDTLLGMVKEHGAVRLFSTALRGEYGSVAEVEVSAARGDGDEPCVGLSIRDVGRRLAHGPTGARDLTRAVEDLTRLVGKVALRDLIRDTVDLMERHFIEAALELTGDNRTLAAEVLGVSRQSLYVKLRRYGHELKEDRG